MSIYISNWFVKILITSPHCPSYKNNALKGASAVVINTKQLMFNSIRIKSIM